MSPAARWEQARNILAVRLDALGDVLMTTPALRALKESLPGRRITLLTSSGGAAVAPFVPEIDATIAYDAPWVKASEPRASSGADRAMIDRLRRAGFDAAVIFTVFSQNPLPAALLCCLADIPLRLAHCRENPYQLLTNWIPDPEPARTIRHEVRRQLDLVAAVGCRTDDEHLSFQVPQAARARVIRLLAEIELDRDRPCVVIHPGATAPSRRYSPEHFAAAARELSRLHGTQIIYTGTERERDEIEYIRHRMGAPSWSLAGRLNLGELGALLSVAPLLIANNTGPVHIAAAVGTPVVDLYALTNPQHTPWAVPHRVLSHDVPCKYCYKSVCPEGHHDCLRRVAPAEVVAAALELLRETRQRQAGTGTTEEEVACIPLASTPRFTTPQPVS
jgi:lipopolysaccharide heptosyltransferase II